MTRFRTVFCLVLSIIAAPHRLPAQTGDARPALDGKISVTIAGYKDRFVRGERVYVYTIVTNLTNTALDIPAIDHPGAFQYTMLSADGDTLLAKGEMETPGLVTLPARDKMEAVELISERFANDTAAVTPGFIPGIYQLRASLGGVSSNPLRVFIDPVPPEEEAVKSMYDNDIVLGEKASLPADSIVQRSARLLGKFPSSKYAPLLYEAFIRGVEKASVQSSWKFYGLEAMVRAYIGRFPDYPPVGLVPASWSHILALQNGWSRDNLMPSQLLIIERGLNEMFASSRSRYVKRGLAEELARLRPSAAQK